MLDSGVMGLKESQPEFEKNSNYFLDLLTYIRHIRWHISFGYYELITASANFNRLLTGTFSLSTDKQHHFR